MNIKMSRKWLVSLSVTLGILILLWVISSALAQGPEPEEGVSAAAMLNSRISYQGLLKESGTPVTGNRNMIFNFYTNNTCSGVAVQQVIKNNVPVTDGLFSVELDVTHGVFWGEGVWLEVEVGGTSIGCQEILPAPYALSLRPGADVVGDVASPSAVLNVTQPDAGSAAFGLYGYAPTVGIYGLGVETGVKGHSYGHVGDRAGVYGESVVGVGVRGISAYNNGVYGESNSSSWHGVHGYNSGSGDGVYGTSGSGYGVHGEVGGYQTAVYGHNTSTLGGLGVWGKNEGSGAGVTGQSSSGPGVHGYSSSGYGVQGFTDATYGFYTPDSLYVAGTCTGGGTCNEDIAEYIDAELDVEPGDVVIAVAPATVGKSTQPNDTRVVGIISTNPAIVFPGGTDSAETEGNRLPLALAGVAPCKASAENGPITPGDLLVASATPGHAMRADPNPPVGTVIGKALEPLDEGTGLIQMLVMLQ